MEKDVTRRNRCSRSQIYDYVLHLILDNASIQGKRKGFRLKDTDPQSHGLSFSEGYRILRDLSNALVIERVKEHPRKWMLSEYTRERLSHIEFDQRRVIAQRLTEAIKTELHYQVKADNGIRWELLDALGFSKDEIERLRL